MASTKWRRPKNAEHITAHDGGFFFDFVAQGYITQVAMTIRKHAKDDDSISFMRVLEQVKKCAPQFTYGVYLQQHPIQPNYVNWQRGAFDLFTDAEGGGVVSVGKVASDIEELKELTAKVVRLCDRELAHLDKRGFSESVTFGEVENCIDAFDRLVCKYFKQITLSLTGYTTLEASILANWEDVFTVPMDLKHSTWRDTATPDEY